MIDVVLVELKIPENIGFIARVMKNFGFRNLVLYNCNVGRVSLITASHARDLIENARIIDSLEDYLGEKSLVIGTTGIRSRNVGSYIRKTVTPEELRKIMRSNAAILFGREDFGLFDEELRLCNVVVSIPTSEEYPVMNVSHAAAVILYELSKTEPERGDWATQRDVDVLVDYFDQLMHEVWYPRHRIQKSRVLLKRAFGRAGMSKYEMNHIAGIIRKTVLYIKHLKEEHGAK
ncbi:RNA methyltransferase, TrmH family, group 1 [Geoglobus ahangari]|uniref:RNA methyltransferase, TrmH family, group 1 n=1 Tax=Geoglobus ahangari TaxID=113653 RepID=A0A0F7II53_9EURY|nr:RNA methyltransferase [Geoglobus ahangari]AKG91719.1 RNA methyltransferase, TrmH family, group 1 [Geoglobus ahangari]